MSRWPGTADDVIRRVRRLLTPEMAGLDGLDRVRITADMRGDDLEHLTIDASRATLRFRPNALDEAPEDEAEPAVRSRRPAHAHRIRVLAQPARIEGVPFTIDAELVDVPIDWIEYVEPSEPTDPDSVFGVDLRDGGEGMRGTVSASMPADAVGGLITRAGRAALQEEDVAIRHVRVGLNPHGADGVEISARAGIRWKLLFASATARAVVTVSRDAVVTVHDLHVGSRNPLVAIALFAARRTIREQIGRTLDLNEELPDGGMRLLDVRLSVGDDLGVSFRVG